MTIERFTGAAAVTFFAALMLIASVSPEPDRVTDRKVYERTAEQVIVPDCSDLQCFRVLVPWVLGRLPGASTLRWRTYAAASGAAAGTGVLLLCVGLGMSRRAALMAATMSAFGFGTLYALHDSYTSDPLMYALGPIVTTLLLSERTWMAGALGAAGVMAKEFAAAPLYAWTLYQAMSRQWLSAARTLVAANAAFIVWITLTLTLMLRFNYRWGWNGVGSANLAGGSALALWAAPQSARGIASAMLNEFGALYVLAPAGLLLAPPRFRRLAVVSLPIAALFAYVQQPDRALWNFHYLVTPPAALILDRVPSKLAWSTIALFVVGNLRVGAQLPIAPWGRIALTAALVLAVVSVAAAWRRPAAAVEHRFAFDEAGR
jgi:hypothetical protein